MKILKNVLLIDDDPAINYLHEINLSDSGLVENVHIIHSVKEGIEFILSAKENNQLPELIFLDVNIPGKSGWEFVDEYDKIRIDEDLNSIIIMLSNSTYYKDIDKAKEYKSIREYLMKPLSIQDIKKILDTYF